MAHAKRGLITRSHNGEATPIPGLITKSGLITKPDESAAKQARLDEITQTVAFLPASFQRVEDRFNSNRFQRVEDRFNSSRRAGDGRGEKGGLMAGTTTDFGHFASSAFGGIFGAMRSIAAQAGMFGSGPDSAGDGTGGGCFIAGTMIKMVNGADKPIEEIRVGDKTAGGTVSGTMQFDAAKEDWYDFEGVTVSATHLANEAGIWKRVEDTDGARRLPDWSGTCYLFDCTTHRIYIGGSMFSDWQEVDADHPMWKDFLERTVELLNQQEEGPGIGESSGGGSA